VSIVKKYLEDNKIDVKFYFGKTLVTTMTGNGLSLVDRPFYYRDLWLESLLDHEIGTHYVRSTNQRNLSEEVNKILKKKRIGWSLATEEGVACLSNHIHYQKCNLLFVEALRYYAVCIAAEASFFDTFKALQKYVTDFDDCW
jgi:hypothetical protein